MSRTASRVGLGAIFGLAVIVAPVDGRTVAAVGLYVLAAFVAICGGAVATFDLWHPTFDRWLTERRDMREGTR